MIGNDSLIYFVLFVEYCIFRNVSHRLRTEICVMYVVPVSKLTVDFYHHYYNCVLPK